MGVSSVAVGDVGSVACGHLDFSDAVEEAALGNGEHGAPFDVVCTRVASGLVAGSPRFVAVAHRCIVCGGQLSRQCWDGCVAELDGGSGSGTLGGAILESASDPAGFLFGRGNAPLRFFTGPS
jgi:hypothetical protein